VTFSLTLLLLAGAASPVGGGAAPLPSPAALDSRPESLFFFSGLEYRPVVGDWAEYELTRRGKPSERVRVAVVGRETEPADAFWLELTIQRPERRLLAKILSVGHPAHPGAIKRIVVQLGPSTALDLPAPPEEPSATPPKQTPKGGKPVTVVTKAGTFRAVPLALMRGAPSLVSSDVPVFGLVRGPAGEGALELLRHGKGAVSEITATPQRMGMPLLPASWAPPPAPDAGSTPGP
jgi:hypothetical protein